MARKRKEKRSEILISPVFSNQMSEEFDCHIKTIRDALQYRSNSNQAKMIRKRAKELLRQEAKNVQDYE